MEYYEKWTGKGLRLNVGEFEPVDKIGET